MSPVTAIRLFGGRRRAQRVNSHRRMTRGNSLQTASIRIESPIFTLACISLPSEPGSRIISTASNAFLG